MQTLFYNNYSVGDTAFTGDLQRLEVHNAITMHPVKRTPYLYRLHNYLQSVKINDLHMKITSQYREIQELKELLHEDGEESVTVLDQDARRYGMPISLNQYIPDSHRDVIPWNYFSRYVYHCRHDSPRMGLTQSVRTALKDIVMQVMKLINSNSQKVGRTIEYKEILYGYSRVTPNRGADYILDLLLIYKKHRGTSRTLSVRRHAYLHQSFDRIEFKEEEDGYASNVPATGGFQSSLSIFGHKTNSDPSSQLGRSPERIKATIHFIMPLSGRLEIFQRFMKNYERVCLKTNENTKLLVILFKKAIDDPSADIIRTVMDYQKVYPGKEMKVIQAQGDFSRGLALELGAGQYGPDALMFFVDVDMYLSQGFLNRCRMNTDRRKSVYFPVVFSQYSPDIVFGSEARQGSQLVINNDAGYFRHFGFGLVCLYHGDMNDVGGMNNAIVGWGMEDVDLYEKFVQSNMTIFRGPDTGLVHIYHPVICDPRLEAKQYQMCIGSRASTYGSNIQLARILQEMSQNKKGGKKADSHEDEDYDGR
ncbi:chondroitin sulfate synthase 1-like [Lytechinus variegatus]|uniref:chondroitin sulfate synthase 1-like n=1 Tax=Lytechinus variegatus TaxID=7654 RepID=UPI001BB1219E|nr:chondroitin sulfate synthase 1-like [Lytechinus variegatus]